MSKRFCLRGHDTEVEGRSPSHACRECRRILARPRDRARDQTPERKAWYRARDQKPKRKAYNKAYLAEYRSNPENKARQKVYQQVREQRPEVKWEHKIWRDTTAMGATRHNREYLRKAGRLP